MLKWSCWGWKQFERNWRSSIWFHLPSLSLSLPPLLVLSVFLPANSSLVAPSTTWSSSQSQKGTIRKSRIFFFKRISDWIWRKWRRGIFFSSPSDTQETFQICLFKECWASTYALFSGLTFLDNSEKEYYTLVAPGLAGATFQLLPFRLCKHKKVIMPFAAMRG